MNATPTDGDEFSADHLEPVPSWLEEPPDTRPALTATRLLILPFHELTAENFERLVLQLAQQAGDVEYAQLYGVRGQDQHGIDLYCRMRAPGADGRLYRVVQCRNVATVTPHSLAAAVEDFLEGDWASRTETFVFATRVTTVRSERAEAVEAAATRLSGVGIGFEVWDGEALSTMLHEFPALVDRFFGRDAVRLFCGDDAARQLAGRDQARAMFDGLEARLRARTPGSLTAHAVRDSGSGDSRRLVLDRTDVRQRVTDAIREASEIAGVVVVHGEPDVGKSALVLDVVASLRGDGTGVLAFSLRDVLGPLTSFEQLLGAPVAQVLADLTAEGIRLIVLDGAEVVLEGGEELLTDIARAAVAAGIGVTAVVRDDARRAVVDALRPADPGASVDPAPAGQSEPVLVTVPTLVPEDITRVRATFPEMARLADDPRAAWLLGRVGLVDLLLRSDAVGVLPDGARSEADVFTAVWSRWVRRGERVDRGGATPDGRDAAMTELARRRLFPNAPTGPLDPHALASLRSDGLLLSADERFAWSSGDEFISDVVRDLATTRLLVRDGTTTLDQALAPRWALRAARIAHQITLIDVHDRNPGSLAAIRDTVLQLLAEFDQFASRHGDRWADVPWDAVLTTGRAESFLEACAQDLLDEDARLLRRVLRLVAQRHSVMNAADPVLGAPVVAFILDHAVRPDAAGPDSTMLKTIASWLRGVAQLERNEDLGQPYTAHQNLRQRIRDYLLEQLNYADPTRMECLALLGSDADDRVQAVFRDLAARRPAFLGPCVERVDAMISLARFDIDLLFELTKAYYIDRLDGRGRWGYTGLEDGIRHHESGTGPQAAWYYGPFWQLLHASPVRALALINEMLDHAAAVRIRGLVNRDVGEAPKSGDLPGATFDVASLGERHYVGDEHVWAWYRGSTVGPRPCMSALLAVERFVDAMLSQGLPLSSVGPLLLCEAHNLAMAGVVVGVLTRHLDRVTTELDEWLASPTVWQLEAFRRTQEGRLHVQGRDPQDMAGRDRRTWTPINVAGAMVAAAWLSDDQERLDQLRTVGDRLVATRQMVVSAESAESPTEGSSPAADLPRSTSSDGVDDALLSVRRWASMLDSNQYRLTVVPEGAAWEWRAPADIEAAMAATQRDLDRINETYRLINTYGLRFFPPADERPASTPTTTQLTSDLSVARTLLEDPPNGGPSATAQAATAVAAYAVKAASEGTCSVGPDDLEWSAVAVLTAALHPPGSEFAFDGTLYATDSDRAAATSVPYLLLPDHTETPLEPDGAPLVDEEDLAVVADAVTALTTSLYTEVRRIAARTLDVVWAAPCGPGPVEGALCRHVIAWSAVEAGARDVALTSWTPEGRRDYQQLAGPIVQAMRDTPASGFMFTRLGPAVISACDAARSHSCVATRAVPVRAALLDAYARVAVHWGSEGYDSREEDRCAVAEALLATAASDAAPLLAVIAGLSQARALSDTLNALSTVATYDATARATFRTVWPAVMDTILDAVEAGATVFSEHFWGGYALAAVIPSPHSSMADSTPADSMTAARPGWPTPDQLQDRVERWLPHAVGHVHTADDLIGLLQVAPLLTQARLGLPWLRTVILTNDRWSNSGTWHAVDWLQSLRDGNVLDEQTRPAYNELVDALAAAGYHAAVTLQHVDE